MPNPTDELKQLQNDLAQRLADSESANNDAKAIRTKIEAVQRQITEQDRIAQAVAAKKTAYTNDKLAETIADGMKTIPAALEATSAGAPKRVDTAVDAFDAKTVQMQKDLDALQTDWSAKSDAVKQGESDLAAARTSFENTFKLADSVGAQIDQIKALKTKINLAENAGDHVAAYVYVKEASKQTATLAFPDAAALATAITTARQASLDAATKLETKKSDLLTAKTKLDDAAKALTARQASRSDLVLAEARKV